MPDSLEQLDMLLVHVPKPRKVLRDGIRLMGRRYVEPTLAAFVGEQVEAVYDPRDLTEIQTLSAALDYGNVAINTVDVGIMNAPYGGRKQSGVGYEHGREGLLEYFNFKHVRLHHGVGG